MTVPAHPVHRFEVMHHTDETGKHWCPTGFLWCPTHDDEHLCEEFLNEEPPYECEHWGEIPA